MRVRVVREERGVTAVIVAVSLVGIVAMLMLAVDAGNVWQTRRQIITATDSAVLSAARTASLSGPSGACNGWTAPLTANAGADVQPGSCTVASGSTGSRGWIGIDARKPAAVRFGGLFGIGDKNIYSYSAARWQVATNITNLRPIGFCLQNQHVQEWLAYVNSGTPLPLPANPDHPTQYSGQGAGLVHRMPWAPQFQDGQCGSTPGNWGFFDLNGGNNSVPELDTWLREGYNANSVAVGDCNADNQVPNEWCQGDTGAKVGLVPALESLIGKSFAIAVFDTGRAQGATARFHLYGFLGVTLWDFKVTGPNQQWYIDLEFVYLDAVPGDKCCPTFIPGSDLGVRVIRLCNVDHSPNSDTSNCS